MRESPAACTVPDPAREVFGGRNPVPTTFVYQDLWAFDLHAQTWTEARMRVARHTF